MRRLMAANWKMYKTSEEAAATIEHLSKLLGGSAPAGSEILVFAPFTALEAAAAAMRSLQGGLYRRTEYVSGGKWSFYRRNFTRHDQGSRSLMGACRTL